MLIFQFFLCCKSYFIYFLLAITSGGVDIRNIRRSDIIQLFFRLTLEGQITIRPYLIPTLPIFGEISAKILDIRSKYLNFWYPKSNFMHFTCYPIWPESDVLLSEDIRVRPFSYPLSNTIIQNTFKKVYPSMKVKDIQMYFDPKNIARKVSCWPSNICHIFSSKKEVKLRRVNFTLDFSSRRFDYIISIELLNKTKQTFLITTSRACSCM